MSWEDTVIKPRSRETSKSLAEAFGLIYEKRKAARNCSPSREDGCDCHICRWSARLEDIKTKLSKEDAEFIEDLANSVVDAETEKAMVLGHLEELCGKEWWNKIP